MKKLTLIIAVLALTSCNKEVIEPTTSSNETIQLSNADMIIGDWNRTYQEVITDSVVTYTEIDTDNGTMYFDGSLIHWKFEDGTTNILGSYTWTTGDSFTLGTGQVYYIDLITDTKLIMHFNTNSSVTNRMYYDKE